MKAPKFERNKFARLIRVNGIDYIFSRPRLDEYKEPMQEKISILVRGIFHETVSHITVMTSDSATVQDKPSPYILCLYNDITKEIKQGDEVIINNKQYHVTGINDLNNWGIVLDVSLELVV